MMARRPFLGGLGGVGASLLGLSCAKADPALAGTWTGVLGAGAQQLRLRLEIGPDGDAKLFSLDQGGAAIPARLESGSPDRVRIVVPAVSGRFEGKLSGDRLEGVWSQGSPLPLTFRRGEAGLALPPPAPLSAERIRALRVEAGSPALAAIAQRRGGPAKAWADGVRTAGGEDAVARADRWHIGSITKSFTATLVARLVEAGAVRWEDTAGDLLGAAAPDMFAAYRGATFRHLLSHRSGLPANIPALQFMRFSRTLADARAERASFVRIALAMTPEGPAERTFVYSNNGYVVAGAMLEAKLGQSWETLVAREVFAPLGLRSAGFGAPGPGNPVGHAARLLGGGRQPHPPGQGVTDNPVALGPAGTIHLSLDDLLTYLAAHRDRSPFLSPENWARLHTPPFGGDYALGWIVRPDGARWHNGSNTLWYAEAQFDAETGLAGAAVVNDGVLAKSEPAVSRALAGALAAV